jgi:hypothetical protein
MVVAIGERSKLECSTGEAHYKLLLESCWHVVLALLALELSPDLSVASSCLDLQCIASLHLVVCLFH